MIRYFHQLSCESAIKILLAIKYLHLCWWKLFVWVSWSAKAGGLVFKLIALRNFRVLNNEQLKHSLNSHNVNPLMLSSNDNNFFASRFRRSCRAPGSVASDKEWPIEPVQQCEWRDIQSCCSWASFSMESVWTHHVAISWYCEIIWLHTHIGLMSGYCI